MKKLSTSTRQRKKQATTTNMVHVRQVESRTSALGNIRRTRHNRVRSSESMVQSSNSVDEEESVPTSFLSNEMLAAEKIKSQESTTDAGTPHKDSTFRSSHEPSESSLTLSLPKEIRTSWLENEPSSRSDMDAVTAKRMPPGQLQRTHTSESRSTAKSIFSTNKSVIMETQRNSISGRQPDGSAATAAMQGQASSRPPDYPPEVTSDPSEYSDVHQYQSLDASFNSHSDKEFRSASSKVPASEQETQRSDVALGVVPPGREDSESGSQANQHGFSSHVDAGAVESQTRPDVALRDSRSEPAVPINANTSMVARTPDWSVAERTTSLLEGVSSRDAVTEMTRSAMDVPSGASMDSRKDWSTDFLPANPISPTVSDHDAAASLQNIPGKMADLFQAFAAPANVAEEATSVHSSTFHALNKSTDKTGKPYGSSQNEGHSSQNSRDLLPGQEANRQQVFGVAVMLGSDVPAASPHLDARASQQRPPGFEELASHVPLPDLKFSREDDWDIAHKAQATIDEMPEAAWWNSDSGLHPSGVTSSEQQQPITVTGPGVPVPRPAAQQPQKHHSASQSQAGAKLTGVQNVRRVIETVTETHSRKSQSHTQSYVSEIPAAPGNLRATASAAEQPRETSVTSNIQDDTVSLKGAQDKRAKPEAAMLPLAGQRSPKSADVEHHKHPSMKRTQPVGASTKEQQLHDRPSTAQPSVAGAAFSKGEQRHKRSSHSPTTSGTTSPKVSAQIRSEHPTGRRSPAGTSSTKVATGVQLQKTPSVLDWRGVASTIRPDLAPIDERLERSTTSFSISELAIPKPKAHERGAANDVLETAQIPVAASSVIETATNEHGKIYPLPQETFLDPAAVTQLATAPHTTIGDEVTETTKLSESKAVRPNVTVEQRFQQSVTRSYSLAPLTQKGPDEDRKTGFSATISSDVNIVKEHEKTSTEYDVSPSVLHPEEKSAAHTKSEAVAVQGEQQSHLPEKSSTADVLKETKETGGKTGELEKISQQITEAAEKPEAAEALGQTQGGDDLKLSGQPHKPEAPDGVTATQDWFSPTEAGRVLSLAAIINQPGLTSVADIFPERPPAVITVPEKTADTFQETLGEERLKPSASSPVSTEGREPGFLFEEPLKRPIVSSSWTETSTQDEERRRSSGAGAPRAAHTVPAAAGEDHTGHRALSRGEAEAHHRRTSAPSTGLQGPAGASVLPEEGAAAEGSIVPREPTAKGPDRGSQNHSHYLTSDSGSTQSTKRAEFDHHGDMSRKSEEEVASGVVLTQDREGAITGGIFLDESDRLRAPGSEESASERPATLSDSRGFQPLFGENLRPPGASEPTDAVRKGTCLEDIARGVPTAVLLEADVSVSRDSTEDGDVEKTKDLSPPWSPDELRHPISAVHLASEPREPIDFEQSTGVKLNMREDGSSPTVMSVSSGGIRKEFGAGPHGLPSELIQEEANKYYKYNALRELSESELCRRLAGSPTDLVFAETALLSRSTSPSTALIEIPPEQRITEAPSREVLEQQYLGSDDEPPVGSPAYDSEQPAGSRGMMMGGGSIFHVRSPLAGIFPPVQVTVLHESLAEQQEQTSTEQFQPKPPKERKHEEVPAQAGCTFQGALDTAAPVVAFSLALFAFVAAAAILLTRDDDLYTDL